MVSHSEKNHAADPVVVRMVAATKAKTGLLMPNRHVPRLAVLPGVLFGDITSWLMAILLGDDSSKDEESAVDDGDIGVVGGTWCCPRLPFLIILVEEMEEGHSSSCKPILSSIVCSGLFKIVL